MKSETTTGKVLLSLYVSFLAGGLVWAFAPVAAVSVFLGVLGIQIIYIFASGKLKSVKLLKYAAISALFVLLLVGVASVTLFVPDQFPNIEQNNPTWKKALLWMQKPENVPTDAKMFNWWDEGHWITFVGERAALVDNRNLSWEGDQDFAKFVVTKDVNEAVGIVKRYDSDYVVLANDMFYKLGSFGHYAYNTTNNSDPRIIYFLVTPHYPIPCSKTTEQGIVYYVCGENKWNEQQMNSIPTSWGSGAAGVTQQSVPYSFYRDSDNANVYFLNLEVNESMLSKVWFHHPDTLPFFEEVYGSEGVKIFKVKKE